MAAVLAPDPAWRAEPSPGGLLLIGGADAVYLLPDVGGTVAAELVAVFAGTRPPSALGAEAGLLVPQLRGIGALRVETTAPLVTVGLRVVGAPAPALAAELARLLGPAFVAGDRADLVVVLRTTGLLRDLIDLAGELPGPHLLCDVANRRTVVLGPLVVPGLSACLGCLAGRVGRRWGDPEPPAVPAALEETPLVAALVHSAVRGVAAGRLSLLERTTSLDLHDLTGTAEDVLPAAGCPHCPSASPIGIRLPWEDAP
ncbi:MAG TPA: hypothetical protein VGD67_05065 [Pseudonocardiaceae bacterium]